MLKIHNNHIPFGLYEIVDQNSAALTVVNNFWLPRIVEFDLYNLYTKYKVTGQAATVTGVMTQ